MTSREFLKRKSQGESSRSGSHMITIIQNFTLVSLTSSMTPHPIGLPFGAAVPFLPMHSSLYIFVSLCTCLSIHSSPYVLVLPLHLYTSRMNIPLRYLSEIVHLSRHHPRLSQYATRRLRCWLDAIDVSPLCNSQLCHQLTRVTGWMTSGHLKYVINSMTKAHL